MPQTALGAAQSGDHAHVPCFTHGHLCRHRPEAVAQSGSSLIFLRIVDLAVGALWMTVMGVDVGTDVGAVVNDGVDMQVSQDAAPPLSLSTATVLDAWRTTRADR